MVWKPAQFDRIEFKLLFVYKYSDNQLQWLTVVNKGLMVRLKCAVIFPTGVVSLSPRFCFLPIFVVFLSLSSPIFSRNAVVTHSLLKIGPAFDRIDGTPVLAVLQCLKLNSAPPATLDLPTLQPLTCGVALMQSMIRKYARIECSRFVTL